ncbi:MAG: hypothetical protein ACE5HP_10935 [Gemmatimonadota bacterium]
MSGTTAQEVLRDLAAVIAGFYVLLGISVPFELGGIGSGSLSKPAATIGLLAAAVLIVAGVLLASRWSRWLGWMLMAVGFAGPASQMAWAAFTPIPWILLVAFLVMRAIKVLKKRRATP